MTMRLLLLALLVAAGPGLYGQGNDPAQDLAAGIAQVEEGDLETAVITLDGVVQRLAARKGREKELATAHIYLAMAHLGLSRMENAKAELREAWKHNKDMTLDPKKFPPAVLQMFEEARRAEEAARSAPRPTQTASEPAPPVPAVRAKKGRSKTLPILLGLGAAGGIGVAVAVAGGGGGGGTGGGTPPGTSANRAPTASITVSDPQPLMGATSVSFNATASDPDGDSLTYTWAYGDGTSGGGAATTHVYQVSGTFTATLTVTDTRGASATQSSVLTVRSVQGNWFSEARAWRFEIRHTGSQISGRLLGFRDVSYPSPPSLSGTVRASRTIVFDVPGFLSFEGVVDGAAARMTGTLSETSRNFGEVLVRQ